MSLPPVNKAAYGDIKKLSDVRLKVTPGDKVPRVAPGAGRPSGSSDSYQRIRQEHSVGVVSPRVDGQSSPQDEWKGIPAAHAQMLDEYIRAKANLAELDDMASQPGASPVIVQMRDAAAGVVESLKQQATQGTPYFNEHITNE